MSPILLDLESLLGNTALPAEERLRFLAVFSLGLVEALRQDLLDLPAAEAMLFRGGNGCLVRDHNLGPRAEAILSRGVQLADLAEALPAAEAAQELPWELLAIRDDAVALLREVRSPV